MQVSAITGSSQVMQTVPVTIVAGATNELALYAGAGIAIAALVGGIIKKKRR
jgi:hypothetical protein